MLKKVNVKGGVEFIIQSGKHFLSMKFTCNAEKQIFYDVVTRESFDFNNAHIVISTHTNNAVMKLINKHICPNTYYNENIHNINCFTTTNIPCPCLQYKCLGNTLLFATTYAIRVIYDKNTRVMVDMLNIEVDQCYFENTLSRYMLYCSTFVNTNDIRTLYATLFLVLETNPEADFVSVQHKNTNVIIEYLYTTCANDALYTIFKFEPILYNFKSNDLYINKKMCSRLYIRSLGMTYVSL